MATGGMVFKLTPRTRSTRIDASLNISSRSMISLALNPMANHRNTNNLQQDFRGLAELMGFSYREIQNFMLKSDPANTVLDAWATRQGSTIGCLWDILEQLEIFQLTEDERFIKSLENDADRYHDQQANQMQEADMNFYYPIQDPEVTGSQPAYNGHGIDETMGVTVTDVTDVTSRTLYDAFVCHTYEDIAFVKEMIDMLEGIYGLRLCVPERDILPGAAKHTVTATLISQRCRKVVIILSPDFLKSPQCDFQLKFTQSLNPGCRDKKLIPVKYKNCFIPPILNFVTLADFTRGEVAEWFWKRLAAAIKHVPTLVSEHDEIDIPMINSHQTFPQPFPNSQDSMTSQSVASPSPVTSPSSSRSSLLHFQCESTSSNGSLDSHQATTVMCDSSQMPSSTNSKQHKKKRRLTNVFKTKNDKRHNAKKEK